MQYRIQLHKISRLALIVLVAGILGAQTDVPQVLQPPTGQALLLTLRGKGNQIYECQNSAGVYTWKLKAPDAKLFKANGDLAGRHFAGPTWEGNDGSRVTGKLKASVPAPDPASIPWLLLTAVSHDGTGVMSNVQSVQRVETKGGLAPTAGCHAGEEHKDAPIPYEATYNFYGDASGH